MKRLLVLLVVMAILIPFIVVQAAKPGCESSHVVRASDTLRSLSTLYNIDAWWLVKANNKQAERPNYPIYLGSSLCIPESVSGTPKKLPAYVLDQPPADFYPRLSGKQITISAYNFGRGSIWLVKVDGKKARGTFKIASKALAVKSFTASGKLVCLKNIRTDFVLCRKTIQPVQ